MNKKLLVNISNLSKAFYSINKSNKRFYNFLFTTKSNSLVNYSLKNINFKVYKGQSVAIIGNNGSGKSTLLKLISKTLRPSSGKVDIFCDVVSILELGIGFNHGLTCYENILLSGQILGFTKSEVLKNVDNILIFSGLEDKKNDPLKTFSSGMVARLAFSIATIKRPDLLILDEVLSVGDYFFQKKCFDKVNRFIQDGTTVLFVSHDLTAVKTLTSQAVWLDKGAIVMQGATKNVTDKYFKFLNETSSDENESDIEENISYPETKDNAAKKDFRNNLTSKRNFNFQNIKTQSNEALSNKIMIEKCYITHNKKQKILFHGGERVQLKIFIQPYENFNDLIIGFLLKNKNGLELFGDNTFLVSKKLEKKFTYVKSGNNYCVTFDFIMPYMKPENYFITAAIAIGTQDKYKILDWKDDILQISFVSKNSPNGLVGIPMINIDILKVNK